LAKSTFVYVTYIAASPEKVWKALLDGEFTRQYWGHENVSDWKPGSPGSTGATMRRVPS
jgi:uncharacterized protein YndB with AHSA1/START domain